MDALKNHSLQSNKMLPMSTTIPREKAHDNAVFVCFGCQKRGNKIFAKINRTALQYVVCESKCLNIALERLGLVGSEEGGFRSPVNITVRESPTAFVNHTRSPLLRSPGSLSLDKFPDNEHVEEDEDPEGHRQIEQLARKRLKMDE